MEGIGRIQICVEVYRVSTCTFALKRTRVNTVRRTDVTERNQVSGNENRFFSKNGFLNQRVLDS